MRIAAMKSIIISRFLRVGARGLHRVMPRTDIRDVLNRHIADGGDGSHRRLAAQSAYVERWLRVSRGQRRFVFRFAAGRRRRGAAELRNRDHEADDRLRRANRGHRRRIAGQDQEREIQATPRHAHRLGRRPGDVPARRRRGTRSSFCARIAHLRPRTNTFGAIARVRNSVSSRSTVLPGAAVLYIHTPIITASDCEGAGELFRVTTLDP